MPSFEEGTVEYGKNRPPFQKNVNIWAKNGPFFSKSRTCRLYKNRPFLSEIQNDDAYPLRNGVAGPGMKYDLLGLTFGSLKKQIQKSSLTFSHYSNLAQSQDFLLCYRILIKHSNRDKPPKEWFGAVPLQPCTLCHSSFLTKAELFISIVFNFDIKIYQAGC